LLIFLSPKAVFLLCLKRPLLLLYSRNLVLTNPLPPVTVLFLILISSQKYSNVFFSHAFSHMFLALLISININLHTDVITETALLSTTNSFFQSSDTGKSTLLISLDLSAAFDTIDHSILLSRLNTSFGLTGTVYSWLKSYLTDRYQTVQIGQHSSAPTLCTSGVPRVLTWGHYCLPYLHLQSLTSPVYTMFISINMLMIHSFSYLYPHPFFH